jgi:hypothetical protein
VMPLRKMKKSITQSRRGRGGYAVVDETDSIPSQLRTPP